MFKGLLKNFVVVFLIFFVFAGVFNVVGKKQQKIETIGLEKFVKQVNNSEISSLSVEKDLVKIKLKNNQQELFKKEAGQPLSEMLAQLGVTTDKILAMDVKVNGESGLSFWIMTLLPFVIPFILIGVLLYFMMRSVSGANNRAMSFGQSTAKETSPETNPEVTFADVAGAREAKEELKEVVEFLKEPKKFIDLGAKIPRGVLLLGAPGTGKTLLAKAVSGEAGVPFYSMSGSEFVEMFVGVGASRVRDLFKRAKKTAPCIIFVDEIDAVGRRRGSGMGGSHDEREQTLNQILVEMDGFETNAGVIVLAATNRPDVLDPALLRPGRFDRQVMIDEPDLADREAILKIHAQAKPLAKDISLRKIAERTPGFSGADLANVLNEAAILTARHNKKTIDIDTVFSAIEKVMLGPERKSRIITDHEKEVTAYHEAGHAIVAHYLPHTDPVHKISIISRGRAGGYTLKLPIEDRHMQTKTEFIEEIGVLLGGFLTEKIIFKELTTGATSDLRRATQIARKLVTDFGMSDNLGPRTYGQKEEMIFLGREIHEQRDYSEKVSEQIDQEIKSFIDQGMVLAEKVILEKKADIEKVVAVLLKQETIERTEFDTLVGAKPKIDKFII